MSGFLFSSSSTQSSPLSSLSSSSGFGSSSSAPSTTTSASPLFGTIPPSPLYGSTSSTTASALHLFGTGVPSTPSTFSTHSSVSSSGSFLFGNPLSTSSSAPSLFGSSSSTASTTSTTTNLFCSSSSFSNASSAPSVSAGFSFPKTTPASAPTTSGTTAGTGAASVSTGSTGFSFTCFPSATTSVAASSGTTTSSFTGFSLSSISPAPTSNSQTQPASSSAPLPSAPASTAAPTTISSSSTTTAQTSSLGVASSSGTSSSVSTASTATPKLPYEITGKSVEEAEGAAMKKLIVGEFLDFKMVDSRSVISQVQEFQLILRDIHAEGMVLSESFIVAVIIEKLPPSWKYFKNYLRHKFMEMEVEELISILRIEEDNKLLEMRANSSNMILEPNIIEQVAGIAREFNDKCFICNQIGHETKDCKNKAQQGNPIKERALQANIDHHTNEVLEMNLSAVSKVKHDRNLDQWWIDIGITRHVCAEEMMFFTYRKVDGEHMYMNNSSTFKVLGVGKVILKMISGKLLILNDVLHIADIRKNLVSGSMLSKNGFDMIFESDKFVLLENEMFVENGYICDGLFNMNVMTTVTKDEGNNDNCDSR